MKEFLVSINSQPKLRRAVIAVVFLLCAVGIGMRFYNITADDFMFYDEGLYLNHNRPFFEFFLNNAPDNFAEFLSAGKLWLRNSLIMTKVLWVLVSDIRVLWGGLEDWFFPRIISAVAGSLTLVLTFFFAKRFFSSCKTATLSLIFLALLPSHVFYSRLALQEAFCTLFLLCGFYLYLFPERFSWKTFLSSVCFACAFFANYRLIIIPVLVLFYEAYTSLSSKKRFDIRKYTWSTLTFLALILIIGNSDKGQNIHIIFSWMFRQSQLRRDHFDVLGLFSYPYYLFRLESPFFAILFFSNIYCLIRKQWTRLFPFLLVCFYMLIFSVASEKGARYMCVVTPFMAMAAASFAVFFFEKYRSLGARVALCLCVFLVFVMFTVKSFAIARFKTDYKASIQYLDGIDTEGKILTTQHLVLNLYTDRRRVERCPKRYPFLLQMYIDGYKYLIIDPQAYISWTQDGERFSPKLIGFLDFIREQVRPMKIFPHFNKAMLERSVFEHNTNLKRAIAFLNTPNNDYGTLRVYSIERVIDTVNRRIGYRPANREK